MLGPPKARCLDRPVLASLEDLVPAGHFYRHLDATIVLRTTTPWVVSASIPASKTSPPVTIARPTKDRRW